MTGSVRLLGWPGLAQPGRPQFEVALFLQARGHLRRPEVGVSGGGGVAGLFEQVGAYRFEAMGVGQPLVSVERAEQGESGPGSVDVGEGDGAAERHYRPGGDGGEDVVECEDLRPVGDRRAGGLVVQRGDRGLELVRADRAGAESPGEDGLPLGDGGRVPQVSVLVG